MQSHESDRASLCFHLQLFVSGCSPSTVSLILGAGGFRERGKYGKVLLCPSAEDSVAEVSTWVGRGFKKKRGGAAVRGRDGWNGDVAFTGING